MSKKRLNFIVGFRYDKEYGGWVTKVVNLPGCMSQGKTLEEAKKNTKDAIDVCLEVRAKEIKDFKKAVVISTLLPDKANRFSALPNQYYG